MKMCRKHAVRDSDPYGVFFVLPSFYTSDEKKPDNSFLNA